MSKTLEKLLTEAEQKWYKALAARREAVEAGNKFREKLLEWYEQQKDKPLA